MEWPMKKILGNHRRQKAVSATRQTGKTVGSMRGSSGQILVLVTAGLVILTAFAGLAVDVGQFWSARRQMQTAADAAAIAGASALRFSRSPSAAADAVTATNGFTDGTNNVIVTVNNPPASGPYHLNPNYVEVIVIQPHPTSFLP